MKKYLLLVIVTAFLKPSVFSQTESELVTTKRPYQFVPALGIGVGFSKFMGDIQDRGGTNVHWAGNKFGYDAAVSMNLSNSFYVNVNAIIGKISGNENAHASHRNFEASMINAGINFEYNFGGLYKKKRPVVTPFLSAGFYFGSYTVSTDLYDENGNLYYYWSDGKIRNIAENAPDADNAQRLNRDYKFETKLNSNPVYSLSVPVGGGLNFHASKRFVFRLSSKYFFALNDKIDGFDSKPFSKYNDGFFYSSASVFFNLIPDKSNYLPKEFRLELDADDYDGDMVPDVEDECGGTPKGVPVNEQGCPFDTDNDGIPDYLDSEVNSASKAVGTDGIVFDYLKIAQNAEDSIAILHALLQKYPNLFMKSQDQNFTVHVGTFNSSNYRQRLFLQSIPGVVETKINDSLFVYSVGKYTGFEGAEQKKKEIQFKGIENTFEVPSGNLTEVAESLNKLLRDSVETPEQKKEKEAKRLAEEKEKQKNTPKEGKYVAIKVAHSDEKIKQEIQPESEMLVNEVAESKNKEAAVELVEEKKPEPKVEEKKGEVQVTPVMATSTVQNEEKKKQDVVKFSVDVVEYSDKPLPFSVLILMQREGVEIQTARVMGAKIYTIGNYNTLKEAEKIKAELAELNIVDAKIIGSINTIKVTQKEAEEMLKKIGE